MLYDIDSYWLVSANAKDAKGQIPVFRGLVDILFGPHAVFGPGRIQTLCGLVTYPPGRFVILLGKRFQWG